eukprot:353362-Alexandrium_andersonii.AAC.1
MCESAGHEAIRCQHRTQHEQRGRMSPERAPGNEFEPIWPLLSLLCADSASKGCTEFEAKLRQMDTSVSCTFLPLPGRLPPPETP